MKILLVILLAATLGSAQNQSAQNAPARSATKADANAPAIPSGAVELEPNLYRYTDAKGKIWMYRRTPFGFSKWEYKPDSDQPAVQSTNSPRVFDLGDSFRFEQQTPFGVSKWSRKKTELTDSEKTWVELAQAARKSAAPAPASDHAAEKK